MDNPNWPYVEQRHLERRHLDFYPRVFEEETDSLLGHAVNISQEGILLVSSTPLPREQAYKICLQVPSENGVMENLHFKARSIWCRQGASPALFNIGCRLITPHEAELSRLESLIAKLKFLTSQSGEST
jgi:hypothetical protein